MWGVGSVFFTALKPSWNLFVISGVNLGGPAAVYAAIRSHYSDGSSEIFTTDESWKTLRGNPPATFTQVSFDDSLWPTAILEATWDSLVASWGRPTLTPMLPPTNSKWIWTSDNQQTNAPAGSRGFRRSVTDCTKRAVCATAVIAADNLYTFYVNGQLIGSGSLYYAADAWSIPNLDPIFNTFSVNGTNTLPGPAGLIATILITYSDGTNTTITTGASWEAIKSIPDNFTEKFLDDSDWEQATVVGNYGIAPWNVATIPPA
ncbi:hypothetical protein ONZ45_g14991 [Pleurotus djamor]|nr:hypothetical protein ONZ45_g14991 [Pleurotus djamor]